MSRFGLRKRLKKRLGLGGSGREIVTCTITYVLPDGSEHVVQAEERYNVLMASQSLPAPIGTGRRAGGPCPDGRCALCRIEVLDGTGLSPMSDLERQSMQDLADGKPHEGNARKPGPAPTATSRLACHTRIVGDGGKVRVLELFDYDSVRGDPDGD